MIREILEFLTQNCSNTILHSFFPLRRRRRHLSSISLLCVSEKQRKEGTHCGYRNSLLTLHDWCAVHNGYCCFSCFEWFVARTTSNQRLVYMFHTYESFSTTRSGFSIRCLFRVNEKSIDCLCRTRCDLRTVTIGVRSSFTCSSIHTIITHNSTHCAHTFHTEV